jgi:hypothetical protein
VEILERVQNRLNKVPGVTSVDIITWISDSEAESGLTTGENDNAVFYLTLSIAYETIASNSAHYFKFTDGEETVDKTSIFANYTTLAKEARRHFRKQVRGGFGAQQTHTARADAK